MKYRDAFGTTWDVREAGPQLWQLRVWVRGEWQIQLSAQTKPAALRMLLEPKRTAFASEGNADASMRYLRALPEAWVEPFDYDALQPDADAEWAGITDLAS